MVLQVPFFLNKDFVTPNQLSLHETEDDSYVSVCSELLNTVIFDSVTKDKVTKLNNSLNNFKYWETLGFLKKASKKDVLEKLKELRKKRGVLSKAKILLVELILTRQLVISDSDLMILYNGIVYPKVKAINNDRCKKILE